jgi:hypothetical protein
MTTSTFTTAQIAVLEAFAASAEFGKITNDDVKVLVRTEDFEGKTVSMVRGKVVAMKLYKTADASTSAVVSTTLRKSDYVTSIEEYLSINEGSLASLEKASKKDLQLVIEALVALNS